MMNSLDPREALKGVLESWFYKEFLRAPGVIWGPNKRL